MSRGTGSPWMTERLRNAGVTIVILAAIACLPVLAAPVLADEAENWEALLNAAIAAREQARYREAEGLLLSAGREWERAGPNDARMAATLNQLGLVFQEEGRYDRAKPYYEQALEIWERTHGLDHPEAASTLHNLAEIYQEDGDFDRDGYCALGV